MWARLSWLSGFIPSGQSNGEDAGINPRARKEILVKMIKEQYKPGTRVRLLRMEDFQAPPIGTEGTVRGVDDLGPVMVAWDNGCGLNVVLDEDEIETIKT